MSQFTVYHNPRCSKSRLALAYLDEKNEDYSVVEYLKEPLSGKDIEDLLEKLNISAEELLRKGEKDFNDHFRGKNLSQKEWARAMSDYPKLMERPIVVKGGKAVVARPAERINELG